VIAPARLFRPALGLAACAALVPALSCSGDVQRFQLLFDPCSPLVLEPEPDATDEQLEIIEESLALWHDVFAHEATLDEVPGARRLPVQFRDDIWYFGRFNDVRGHLEVATWLDDPEVMAIVLAHELGHAFNLYHVDPDDRLSVMNRGNTDVAPTPGDADELAGLWGDCEARY
jgi:hypothetical protein